MAPPASIDELFRHKSLSEIHESLRQTRQQVESKKQELRELVGDHYRSMLESTDHIRAMSDCAGRVSAGADRVETLIASMRELAASPPALPPRSYQQPAPQAALVANEPDDPEYRLFRRVSALLELPESVRERLGAHEFAAAARLALAEAPSMQREVSKLLEEGFISKEGESGAFDVEALVKQQEAALRGLPGQIAAACVDAFSAVSLGRQGAAEAFAVCLLLRPGTAPSSLLSLFVKRRAELLRGLWEGRGGAAAAGVGGRLAAAALAFEGSVVLSGAIAEGSIVLEAAEALATACKGTELPVAALKSGLRPLAGELPKLAEPLLLDDARGLAPRFGRLLAAAPAKEAGSCALLGGLLKGCTERLLSCRGGLGGNEDWPQLWRTACQRLRPGKAAPGDALAALSASFELACGELVKERAGGLRLELVGAAEEGLDEAVDATGAGEAAAARAVAREQVLEMQRQSRQRVAGFEEQLGEVLLDLGSVKRGGVAPLPVLAGLVAAVAENVASACGRVRLPPTRPLWPLDAAVEEVPQKAMSHAAISKASAHAAAAFDALLAAATGENGCKGALHELLTMAVASGEAELAAKAADLEEQVRQHCKSAYCIWARLAILPEEGFCELRSFWQLAEEEVQHVCGWGNAKFKAGQAQAVPVPVQASAFVFQHLALGARRAAEVGAGTVPAPLADALKAALGEALAASYERERLEVSKMKKGGMSHLLQWLFDLMFLRVALSSTQQAPAYAKLLSLLQEAESIAYSEPVDRLLYQEVIKTAVKGHIAGVRVLLAPFFLHNPLYGFMSTGTAGGSHCSLERSGSGALAGAGGQEQGFELQASYAAPLRPAAPRFLCLPVANASPASQLAPGELEGRLGIGGEDRSAAARAAAAAAGSGAAGAAVSSLVSGFSSGISAFGKSSWWGGTTGSEKPQAV